MSHNFHAFGLDRCECGHIRIAHQSHGSCACEGHLTAIDTWGEYAGPCDCTAFRLKGLHTASMLTPVKGALA